MWIYFGLYLKGVAEFILYSTYSWVQVFLFKYIAGFLPPSNTHCRLVMTKVSEQDMKVFQLMGMGTEGEFNHYRIMCICLIARLHDLCCSCEKSREKKTSSVLHLSWISLFFPPLAQLSTGKIKIDSHFIRLCLLLLKFFWGAGEVT